MSASDDHDDGVVVDYTRRAIAAGLAPVPYAEFTEAEKKAGVVKEWRWDICTIREWHSGVEFHRIVTIGDASFIR